MIESTAGHQKLVDQIACEMGEGGPQIHDENDEQIVYRTLGRKERTIKLLADAVGYEAVETEHKTIDGWEKVDVTFEPEPTV